MAIPINDLNIKKTLNIREKRKLITIEDSPFGKSWIWYDEELSPQYYLIRDPYEAERLRKEQK